MLFAWREKCSYLSENLEMSNCAPGEMLRTLGVLTENLLSVPSDLEPSITPVSGGPVPSAGLFGHCIYTGLMQAKHSHT